MVFDALAPSGYSIAARSLAVSLMKAGVNVSIQHVRQDQLQLDPQPEETIFSEYILPAMYNDVEPQDSVRVIYATPTGIPAETIKDDKNWKKTITQLTWELNKLPPMWCQFLNDMNYDAIFTASKFSATSILNSRELNPPRVFIVPHSIDPAEFHVNEGVRKKLDSRMGFTFLSVAQYIKRKGMACLLPAFFEAFRGEPTTTLVLKTYGVTNDWSTMIGIRHDIMKTSRKMGITIKDTPKVAIVGTMLNTIGMRDLYNTADAFALFSHGEGFGLGYAEAIACGIPVVAADVGGQMDFLNRENSVVMNVNELEYSSGQGWYSNINGLKWAKLDMNEAIEALRRARELVEKGRFKKKQLLATATKLSPENACAEFLKMIDELV